METMVRDEVRVEEQTSFLADARTFYRALHNVACCAENGRRPALRGVLVTATDGQLELVATDTHILGVARVDVEGTLPRPSILELAALKVALKAIRPRKGGDGAVEVKFGADHAYFNFAGRSTVVELVSLEFPNYRQLFDFDEPTVAEPITLGTRVVGKLAKMIDADLKPGVHVEFDWAGLRVRNLPYPVRWTSVQAGCHGLIMPITVR